MSTTSRPASALDLTRVRADFPILTRKIGGRPLVYLDSGATTQKPSVVMDAVREYYEQHNANVHRGVHRLSQEATDAYEGAREKTRALVNAAEACEMIYVRGTTEAVNLVAQSWARPQLGPGDEVLITTMEHHSNIVPWQIVCEQTGATVREAPILDDGTLDWTEFENRLGSRTRVVAITHVSNSLGTVNDIRRAARLARDAGAITVVDGAQAIAHFPVDVQALGVDFYAFSGHKMFAPTGIGMLYGRRELLEEMPPWMGGGDMIRSVSFQGSTWAPLPSKFEAGTPNIGGAIGMGAAIDYLYSLDFEAIARHDRDLLEYGTELLEGIPGLRILGTAPEKLGILSFVLEGAHPHDIGTILDHEGIAVRTGHHCAQPVMDRYGVPATARASFSVFNTHEELDRLGQGLEKIREMFS